MIDRSLLLPNSQRHEGDHARSRVPPDLGPLSALPASVPWFLGGTQGRELTVRRPGPHSARGDFCARPSLHRAPPPGLTPLFVSL